jgi:CHAD domain-containing protein
MAKAYSIKWDQRGSLTANVRRELPSMISAYFAGVREFLTKDHPPRKLHELRLLSKRIRYTLELFRSCYPAELEERLDALKKLQNRLGDLNDAVASEELMREELKRHPKVRKFLEERAADEAKKFVRDWKETFDAPGREAWWTEFLSKPLTPPKSSASKTRKRVA